MEFALSTRDVDGWVVVAVTGELDVYTAPALEEALGELVDADRVSIVVDLTDVSFMDSTGLGLLIKALKWTREKDGTLRIVANTDKILKVFRVTGLDSVLDLHASVSEALEA